MGCDEEQKRKVTWATVPFQRVRPRRSGFGQIELEQKIRIEPTKPRPDFFLSFHEVEG